MSIMGLETPVPMPTMNVYNTDLMKMYIAGVKQQYDTAREEMKDFMKLYQDFYSDVPGLTEMFNQATIGGARNLINQMMQQGVDPYKNPEARAIIANYIASVPTGKLNELRRSAENAKLYKQAAAKLKATGAWGSDDFLRYALGGKLLEEWDPNTPFTATSPYEYKDLDKLTSLQFAPFLALEYLGQSRPGYMLKGTKPERIQEAVISAMADLPNSVLGQYLIELARRLVLALALADGRNLSPEELQLETNKLLYNNIQLKADKFFQPKEESDPLQQGKILDDYRTNNDIRADRQKQALGHYYWTKQHPQYDPKSPFYIGALDENGKPDMRPGSSAGVSPGRRESTQHGENNWFENTWYDLWRNTKKSSLTYQNGQMKQLETLLNKKSGNVNEKDAMKILKNFGVDTPGYFLSKLTSRGYSQGTSSVEVNSSDVKKLYNPKHILGRMVGVTGITGGSLFKNLKNKNFELTSANRQAIRTDMGNGADIKMSLSGPLVAYLNHDGKVKLMLPVSVDRKTKTTDGNKVETEELLYDTGISGTLTETGGFMPDRSCLEALGRLNIQMTSVGVPAKERDEDLY